jgi:UDP-galactopyranose mutase
MARSTIILGGGLAGLSAAFQLEGEAALYEQHETLGGLCRDVRVGDFRFDAVPHVFHFQHAETLQLVRALLGERLRAYTRQARIFTHGRLIRYPFQAHLYGLPPAVVEACVRGRAQAAAGTIDRSSFERWIRTTFGPGIAEHFLLPYNEKFWTLPPSALTCEWVDGLVPVPSRDETARGARAFDPTEYGYNVTFWYPDAGGLGTVMEAFAQRIPRLFLGRRLTRIDTRQRQLTFAGGEVLDYEQLLSSIPLPELQALLDPLPAEVAAAFEALRWTSIAVVHLGVEGPPPAAWHWAYVPDPDVIFYRIGLPSHYAPDAAPAGCHILSAEVAHSRWRPLDRATLLPRVLGDLMRLGLLRSLEDVRVQLPLELRYGYPVYDRQYAWATQRLRAYLSAQGIRLIGRFGTWRYLSVEQTLEDGQAAARALRPEALSDAALSR